MLTVQKAVAAVLKSVYLSETATSEVHCLFFLSTAVDKMVTDPFPEYGAKSICSPIM